MTVKRLEIIPMTVKIFNVAPGPITKRFHVIEGIPLNSPIIEHYHKNGRPGFPWLNESHASALSLATPDEFRTVSRIATKANAVLRALCERRDLLLASVSFEFGRYKGQLLLGGELSPATCSFWDKSNKTKTDRGAYRTDPLKAKETLKRLSNLIQRRGSRGGCR